MPPSTKKLPRPSRKASADVPRLAIACQGGGAHTAFTAGALAYLFLSFEYFRRRGEDGKWFDLLGLSGTSGGAITAAMAWSAAPDGSWAEGARRVLRYWNRNKASLDPSGKPPLWWGEYFSNAASQWLMSWQDALPDALQDMLPTLSYPPSAVLSELIQARMKDDMRAVVGLPADAERFGGRPGIDLFVGAVDVVNPDGEPQTAFRTFPEQMEEGLRLDELLASACIPELFVAKPLSVDAGDGSGRREQRFFWDGLYSQNPPINDFFDGRTRDRKPDLLWVVQINPNRYEGPNCGPDTPDEQADRRNELAGNLSLGQELRSIDRVNRIAEQLGSVPGLPEGLADYKPVTVCFIRLGTRRDGPLARFSLNYASKLNRDPAFIDALIAEGIRAAHEAAAGGELVAPHRSMKHKCEIYPDPDWPTPAGLAELLDDAGLASQWRRLVSSLPEPSIPSRSTQDQTKEAP